MSLINLAITFFLVANPIGNSPTIMALIKNYDFEKQKRIVLREAFFSFLIAIFFQFFGDFFLSSLGISLYALSLTGGIILFTIALQMIFHKPEALTETKLAHEPFIVPIAMPIISGPGLMTMIMVSAREADNFLGITFAIILAWVGVTTVLWLSPNLQKIIGIRGMDALEQIMGMILGFIAVNMIINGTHLFVKTL